MTGVVMDKPPLATTQTPNRNAYPQTCDEQRRAAAVDNQSRLNDINAPPTTAPHPPDAPRGSPPTDHALGSQSVSSIDSEAVSPTQHHKNDAEATDAETRLRARALLRVRLAAIKGTPFTRPGSPFSQNDPGDAHATRESSDGGVSSLSVLVSYFQLFVVGGLLSEKSWTFVGVTAARHSAVSSRSDRDSGFRFTQGEGMRPTTWN
ncbi:hypothetical protein PAXINDRAFT_153444 [Paxillus involutus ATCC 200175]|nr:hypothetical protein PAXINDRAFT_153444 [Paxillus involutus ATCC 200175]